MSLMMTLDVGLTLTRKYCHTGKSRLPYKPNSSKIETSKQQLHDAVRESSSLPRNAASCSLPLKAARYPDMKTNSCKYEPILDSREHVCMFYVKPQVVFATTNVTLLRSSIRLRLRTVDSVE